VFVVLVIQHAMRVRHVLICGLYLQYFSILSHKQHTILEKNTAGSIYNCTAKDVDVTTLSRRTSTAVCDGCSAEARLYIRVAMLFFILLPWPRFTPPSCFRYGTARCDVTFPSQAALSTEL
jgi:hypothetical protein